MVNFNFSETGLGLVSSPHFMYNFPNFIYEFPHELPNDSRHRVLGN